MSNSSFPTPIVWILIGLSLAAGAFGVILFTELSQFLNLPSSWLYAVHPNLGWISALLVLVVLFVLLLHFRNHLLARGLVITYAVLVLGMVWFLSLTTLFL